MRAKIEKANHVVMFETAGEFYAHEVTQGINVGFFACPSCGVKVYPKQDHFFSRDHDRTCIYVKEQFKKRF
ncbi:MULTISPECIES: hypothetical protein [Priestia]|uniref:hypothetical protein n=1 Tax=Priestia TaxID=2800373 RepID=UPI000BEF1F35|nr:hypothetical protein [Priestia aryabhattai]PEI55979.1 hypothetical protein CN635_16810 [Priestia aryabhattai]PHF66002.1 hypothetical protein COI42_23245 [Priestia aryabhattai]